MGTGTAEGPGAVQEKAIRDGQAKRDDMGEIWAEALAHELTEDGNEDRRAEGADQTELDELLQHRPAQDAPPNRRAHRLPRRPDIIRAMTAQWSGFRQFSICYRQLQSFLQASDAVIVGSPWASV